MATLIQSHASRGKLQAEESCIARVYSVTGFHLPQISALANTALCLEHLPACDDRQLGPTSNDYPVISFQTSDHRCQTRLLASIDTSKFEHRSHSTPRRNFATFNSRACSFNLRYDSAHNLQDEARHPKTEMMMMMVMMMMMIVWTQILSA